MNAELPLDEIARCAALARYDILDTLPEPAFDDIVESAAQIAGTPIALISLVDGSRQWFKAKTGLAVTETPRAMAFCAHALLHPHRCLIVPDATADVRFADNPLVLDAPHIRYYFGAPLVTPDNLALGTLCVIDTVPRELTAGQMRAISAMAQQAMQQINIRQGTLRADNTARRSIG